MLEPNSGGGWAPSGERRGWEGGHSGQREQHFQDSSEKSAIWCVQGT